MTPEQKQQAQQAIEGWQSVRNDDPMKPAGDVLAALLQELVDAPGAKDERTASMSEHTKEPWNGKEIPITAAALARAGFDIVYTNYPATTAEADANARRIVACVNACAGIPTELLEKRTDMGAAEVSRLMQLEQQRDKLLAALERCKFDSLNMSLEDMAFCRAVIAEVKGGA